MISNKILREEGIVYVGQWEPIYFLKQNGGHNSENLDSVYDFERGETYVKHLASLGVNQVWTNFFKGYGLAFEDAEQQRVRNFVKVCHRYGLRVFAYCTFGTLALNTILSEQPDAADWVAKPDFYTHAAYSGYQSFRARVDYSSRPWRDYMRRVVDKAIDMDVDGIHFDNAEMSIGFEACRCQRCAEMFRAFLTKQYGPRMAATRRAGQARYGTNDFSCVAPPWYTLSQHPVNQRQLVVPLQQDWVQFRCEVFTEALRELAEHIRARGRLVEANVGKNENINNPYYRGLDYERVYPLVDCSFHENLDHAGFNRHGSPVCGIRSFKVAQSFGIPLMVYARNPLEQAEAFALNPGAAGVAGPFMDPARQGLFDFFRRWRHYNTKTESLAEVAILRHRLSTACDSYYPVQTASAVEQVLQEHQVPFDILAASQLDRLSRYKVLVIPGMRWMRDAEGRKISKWVRAGGALLLIGEVGVRNELNQFRSAVRKIRSIEDLRRAREVAPLFAPLVKRAFDRAFHASAGKGRVAYIPSLDHISVPGTEVADWRVERDHLNAPHNSGEVLAAVRMLLGGRENLLIDAPRHMVAEFRRREDTGEGVIHLLNIATTKHITSAARVAFRWKGRVPHVTCLRWDAPPERLSVRRQGDLHVCEVQDIREHAVLVIPTAKRLTPRPVVERKARVH
jgi:hypothetical protein